MRHTGHRIVPQKHFDTLYAHRHRPEGLAILVGYNEVDPVNRVWQFDHFGIELFLPPLLGERQGAAHAGYAMTISLGRVVFQVVGVERTDLFVPELVLDNCGLGAALPAPFLARKLWYYALASSAPFRQRSTGGVLQVD